MGERDRDWRPAIGARVRNDDGQEGDVVAHHDNDNLGPFVVVSKLVPGGRKLRPITETDWRDGWRVV